MRVVSGIQPSGKLHLGNYYGAIRPQLELQEANHECFYFIADYHALTSLHDRSKLSEYTREIAASYLGLGLDPNRTVFFRQSDVPEVTELAWILSTVTPLGLLQRSHAYKDNLARGMNPTHGLFSYPLLQAADILIYQGEAVPVGADQRQHIEMAQDIQAKFNHVFKSNFLVRPEPVINKDSGALPGIDGRKMSKSYHNTIALFCHPQEARDRFMSIVTDSTPTSEPKDPDKSSLMDFMRAMADADEVALWARRYRQGGVSYQEIKERLIELFLSTFEPARKRYEEWMQRENEIEKIITAGAHTARAVAQKTLRTVRDACGLPTASD